MLQWEDQLFKRFIIIIEQHSLKPDGEDIFLWRFDSSGSFSSKSFSSIVKSYVAANSVGSFYASLAWKGLAPPRAEILVWFTLQGKLNTRERLAILKVIPPVAAICPFCRSAVESIFHVLFVCDFSWIIWANYLCWWEMQWCCPKDPLDFFQAWCGIQLKGLEEKMWSSLFYVVVWILWNIRNRLVFENTRPDWELEKRQIKLRWGFWLKAWIPNKNSMVEELQSNP